MTKTPRPKRKHLERDLIAAQQQRDKAIARLAAAELLITDLLGELDEARAGRPLRERVTEPMRRWLDELSQAVGL